MKQTLGAVDALYPSLTTILGTEHDGRVNFTAIAHVGNMNHGTPQYLSFGVNKRHMLHEHLLATGMFGVSIPGQELVAETDWYGLVSGRTTDKSGLLEHFRGELPHAPMLKACPVCMECRVDRTMDFDAHTVFVGEIVQTHADERVLTDGRIDFAKVRPLLFDMQGVCYWSLGPRVAGAWDAGKALKRAGTGK